MKYTTETFIEAARMVHGDRYDYSKMVYVNATTKVCIICPIHGEFWQIPNSHLSGCGCPRCAGKATWTRDEYETESRKIHGNKYDYSKVIIKSMKKPVCHICPIHGEFWQMPYHHLHGHGCPECAKEHSSSIQRMTVDEFVYRCIAKHGNKYDYSKVVYVNMNTPVCIICPIHGEFWQTPYNHLKGVGCPKCAGTNRSNTGEFIEKARKIHGNKYDYSKVEYVNNRTPVCIICPIHGEFWQKPSDHLMGKGCGKCSKVVMITNDEFRDICNGIYGDAVDFSESNYTGSKNKVGAKCKKHGYFERRASYLLHGKGCPLCRHGNSLSEERLFDFLKSNLSCKIERRKKFSWLNGKHLDFYLPEYRIAIEYQGAGHFSFVNMPGNTEEKFERQKKWDEEKYEGCEDNNVKLFYFSYERKKSIPIEYFDTIYTKEDEFIKILNKEIETIQENGCNKR